MDARKDKLRELEQLPQFPSIATKVLRVLSHDDADVREISDFIRADAALAAGLLRTANSALYSFRSPITSIQNALMMLGFDEVRRFILTFSTQNFFKRPCASICCAACGATAWPAPGLPRSCRRPVRFPKGEATQPIPPRYCTILAAWVCLCCIRESTPP